MFSGSHRQSLRELQQENADIAAIDCVTYALLQRHQPQALAGLVAIGWSPDARAAADHRRRHPGGDAE
jgi:ABC-type phosphate/phosphonate transport system substrate-binding protein